MTEIASTRPHQNLARSKLHQEFARVSEFRQPARQPLDEITGVATFAEKQLPGQTSQFN